MTDTTEGQEQEQEQQAEPTPAEVKASKTGWRPKDEWDDSGSGTWMDAEQFNERNERLADRGDKILKAEISSLKRTNTSLERTLGDLKDYLTKADSRAYKRAQKDLEAKADKAVEEGDTDAYRAAKGEMKELEQEVKAEVTQETTKGTASRDDDPVYLEWVADNPWYDPKSDNMDPEMRNFANVVSGPLADKAYAQGWSSQRYHESITAEVKKKFPEHFGNQRRKQVQAVEGGGTPSGGNGKTLWSQVPKADQATFKRFVSEGVFKDTKEDREKYADDYING